MFRKKTTQNHLLPEIKQSPNLKELPETKQISSSLSYIKSLFPQTLISSQLANLFKATTYFHLITHLPKTAADTLYVLIEGVNYAARSNSSTVLQALKTQLADTCATALTFLDNPQGNYTDFKTLNCIFPEDSITMCLTESNNTEPLLKCAMDFISEYTNQCEASEFEAVLIFAGLALIGLTIVGSCIVKKGCTTQERTVEQPPIVQSSNETSTDYQPLSPRRSTV
ncbi:MAG: hypothetical protein JO131_09595 [Gammaproteobacteria bacterium]|nr:hypothetical protein [Gammaproteobacteria bacterium]